MIYEYLNLAFACEAFVHHEAEIVSHQVSRYFDPVTNFSHSLPHFLINYKR